MHLVIATLLFAFALLTGSAKLVLLALALTTATSAKILAIAGGVYTVLQIAKKFFPSLAGPWALILNLLLSVVGVIVTVPADKLLSVDTLVAVLTAVAASAGIHGTVKNLSAPASAPTSTGS